MDNLDILVSTMHRESDDLSLARKMNIRNNTIIVNQTNKSNFYKEKYNGFNVEMYSSIDRGVSKSRNELLMKSNAKYCLLADDDLVYVNNYKDIIDRNFKKYPDADFIVFNVRIHQNNKIFEKVKNDGKVSWYNCLRYGAVSFCFNRLSILKNNISFNLLFGPGGKYLSGEDTLFIWNSVQKGLKVYSTTDIIADVYNDGSTWFKGYTDRFYEDKGALFRALSSKFYKILILQFAIRKHKEFDSQKSIQEILKLMFKGANNFNQLGIK